MLGLVERVMVADGLGTWIRLGGSLDLAGGP